MQEDIPDFLVNKILLKASPEVNFHPKVTIPSPVRAATINTSLPPMQMTAFGRNFVAAEYPPLVKKDLIEVVSFPANQNIDF